jgi:Leucine-rich repeat (LRR) protein
MVNAQDWLDKNYPKEGVCIREADDKGVGEKRGWNNKDKRRSEITKLDIGDQDLEKKLNLEGFINLKKLRCSYNKLTYLEIKDCPSLQVLVCSDNRLSELVINDCLNLKILHCENNFLTNLDLSKNENLEDLIISDNEFFEQDLSFLSHLVNLRKLEIGNIMSWEQVNPDICNCWVGSLEPLKNLTKLETLEISNTDIDSGLEYLPDSLTSFDCSADKRENVQVKKLEAELKRFGEVGENGEFIRLLRTWRISLRREELTNLQDEKEEVEGVLQQQKREKELIEEAIRQRDQEIEKLRVRLEELQTQIQIPPK